MKIKLFCTISILALLVGVNKVNAVEPLSATELASHCKVFPEQAESIDGQYCIRYIQGFIDGAVATDERVLINIEAELEKKESYSERATRTRAFSLRDRAARYAEFCLGDPISLYEVVTRVVGDFKKSELAADAMARTVVYTSLRKHYPCEPNAKS